MRQRHLLPSAQTTPQARGGAHFSLMKSTHTLINTIALLLMALMPAGAAAQTPYGEYDFQAFAKTVNSGNSYTLTKADIEQTAAFSGAYRFNNTINGKSHSFTNNFAIQPSTSGGTLQSNQNFTFNKDNGLTTTNDRKFYILNLKKGDQVKFSIYTSQNKPTLASNNVSDKSTDDELDDNTTYYMSASGNLIINFVKANNKQVYLKKVTITEHTYQFSQSTATVKTGTTVALPSITQTDVLKSETITYTTSNSDVATVSSNGEVKGVKAGEATITATNESGYTTTCTVTVVDGLPYKTYDFTEASGNSNITDPSTVGVFYKKYKNSSGNSLDTYTLNDLTNPAFELNGRFALGSPSSNNSWQWTSDGFKAATNERPFVIKDLNKGDRVTFTSTGTIAFLTSESGEVSPKYYNGGIFTTAENKSSVSSGTTYYASTDGDLVLNMSTQNSSVIKILAIERPAIELTAAKTTLDKDETTTLTLKQNVFEGETATYTMDNEGVVTLSNDKTTVTAVGYGTVTITATNQSGLSAQVTITVVDPAVTGYSTWDFTTLKAEHFANSWWKEYNGNYGNANTIAQYEKVTPPNPGGTTLFNGLTIQANHQSWDANRFNAYPGVGISINTSDSRYVMAIPVTSGKLYRFSYATSNTDEKKDGNDVYIGIQELVGGTVVEGSGSLNVKANTFTTTNTELKNVTIKATADSLKFGIKHTRTRLAKIEEIAFEPEGPTFSPESGEYGSLDGLTVTMSSAFDDVTIRYKKTTTAEKPTFDESWATGTEYIANESDYDTPFYIHAVITKDGEVSNVATGGLYTYTNNMPTVSYSAKIVTVDITDLNAANMVADGVLPTLTTTNVEGNEALTVEYSVTGADETVAKLWGNELHIRKPGTVTITAQVKKAGTTVASASYTLTVTGTNQTGGTYDSETNTLTFDKQGVLNTHTFSDVTGLAIAFADQESNAGNVAVVNGDGLRLIDDYGFSFRWLDDNPALPIQGSFYVLTPTSDGMLYINGTMEADGTDAGTKLITTASDHAAADNITVDVTNGMLTADLKSGQTYMLYNAGYTPLQLKSISYQTRPAAPVITDTKSDDVTNSDNIPYYNKDITVTATPAEGTKLWYKWATGVADEAAIRDNHTEQDAAASVTMTGLYEQRTLTAYSVKTVGDMQILSEPAYVTFVMQKDDYFTFDYEEEGDQSGAWKTYNTDITATEGHNTNNNSTYYGNYVNGGGGNRSAALDLTDRIIWGASELYNVDFDMSFKGAKSTGTGQVHEFVLLGEAPSVSSVAVYSGNNALFTLYGGTRTDNKWAVNPADKNNVNENDLINFSETTWYHFSFTITKAKTIDYAITASDGDVVVSGSYTFTTDKWQLAGIRAVMQNANAYFRFDNLKIKGIAARAQAPVISTSNDATSYSYNEEFPVTITESTDGSTLHYAYTATDRQPSLTDNAWTEINSGESFTMKNYGDFYVWAYAEVTIDGETEVSQVAKAHYTFNNPTMTAPVITLKEGSKGTQNGTTITKATGEELITLSISATATAGDSDTPSTEGMGVRLRWGTDDFSADAMTINTTQGVNGIPALVPFMNENIVEHLTARSVFTAGNGQQYLGPVASVTIDAKQLITNADPAEADSLIIADWNYDDVDHTPVVETNTGASTRNDGDNVWGYYANGSDNGSKAGQLYIDGIAEAQSDVYFVEFDMQLTDFTSGATKDAGDFEVALLAETRAGNDPYWFSTSEANGIKGEDGEVEQAPKTDKTMFRLHGIKPKDKNSDIWYLNATDPRTKETDTDRPYLKLDNGTWYHFKFGISRENHELSYWITTRDDKTLLANGAGNNTFDESAGVAKVLRFVNLKGNPGPAYSFDNISVWSPKPGTYFYFPVDNKVGKLIDLDFVEPEIKTNMTAVELTQKAKQGLLTYESSNNDVAVVNKPGTHEVMMVNTGRTTITATLWKQEENGEKVADKTASYELTVKANFAEDSIDAETGQSYYLLSTGKLVNRTIDRVPGIIVYMGNSDQKDISNTTIVRMDDHGHRYLTTLERRGWRHMRPRGDGWNASFADNKDNNNVTTPIEPLEGTFYHFKPLTDGKLTFTGSRATNTQGKINNNSIVLYNKTDNTYLYWNGSKYEWKAAADFTAELQTGMAAHTDADQYDAKMPLHTGADWDTLRVQSIDLNYGKDYYLYGNIEGTGGYSAVAQKSWNYNEKTYYEYEKDDTHYYVFREEVYSRSGEGTETSPYVLTEENSVKVDDLTPVMDSTPYEQWSIFQLMSFTYETEFKFAKRSYTEDEFKALEGGTKQVAEGATEKTKYSIIGIGALDVEDGAINQTTGEVDLEKVKGKDGDRGGALIITANHDPEGDGYEIHYAVTIPYENHKWVFQDVARPGFDYTQPDAGNDIDGLTRLRNASKDWLITYKVRQKDTSRQQYYNINKPVLSNGHKLEGDNALYIAESAGLIVEAKAENFGVNVEADTVNVTSAPYNNYGITTTGQDGQEVTTYYTPKVYVIEYWLNGLTGDGYHDKSESEYDDRLDEAIRTMLNYSKNEVTSPDLMTLDDDAKLTIPHVKKGKFVTLWLNRHGTSMGSQFKLTNLATLDTLYHTTEALENLVITGVLGNQGSDGKFSVRYRDADGNAQGAYVFRAYWEGDDEYRDISLQSKFSWVDIYAIEVSDKKASNLRLVRGDTKAEATLANSGFAYKGELSATNYKDYTFIRNSSTDYYPRTTLSNIVVTSPDFNVEVVKPRWGSDAANASHKYPDSKNNLSGTEATNFSDTVTIRINGYKTANKKYGTVKVTLNIWDANGTYLVDRKETWIAIGKLDPKEYPVTWDFTKRNMHRSPADSKLNTRRQGKEYGNWTADSLLGVSHTVDSDGSPIFKPTFAMGTQLTSGTNDGDEIAEALGLGVGLNLTDEPTREQVKEETLLTGVGLTAYDAETEKSGLYYPTEGTMTIPEVGADTYIYVQYKPTGNDSKVTATITSGGEVSTIGSDDQDFAPRTEFESDTVVTAFKVTKAGDVTITVPAETSIIRVGVTDITKQLNPLGYASESRDRAIDHLLAGEFTVNDVNAYAVTEFSNYTLEGIKLDWDDTTTTDDETIPAVKKENVEVVPANTGVIMYLKDKEVSVPMFVPAVNVVKSTNDEDVLDRNMMRPNMTEKPYYKTTENEDGSEPSDDLGGKYSRLILSRSPMTYNRRFKDDGTTVYWLSEASEEGVEGFYRMAPLTQAEIAAGGDVMAANKAYLLIKKTSLPTDIWSPEFTLDPATARDLFVYFADDLGLSLNAEATGIDEVSTEASQTGGPLNVYSLSGQKIGRYERIEDLRLPEGIYIINGRKVAVKRSK